MGISWPFRRKPAPPAAPEHRGPTTVDWVPGDIAECISGGPWWNAKGPVAGPELGSRAIVVEVFLGSADGGDSSAFALRLVGMPRGWGWASINFRKVVLTENGADRVIAKDRPVRRGVDA